MMCLPSLVILVSTILVLLYGQIDRLRESNIHTDWDDRLTPATTIGVSNN